MVAQSFSFKFVLYQRRQAVGMEVVIYVADGGQ